MTNGDAIAIAKTAAGAAGYRWFDTAYASLKEESAFRLRVSEHLAKSARHPTYICV
jgi:hypothetical protein